MFRRPTTGRSARLLPALVALALGCDTSSQPPAAAPPLPSASPAPSAPPSPTPASPVHVQILAINDFHGNLEPPHGHDGTVRSPSGEAIPAGGVAYLATLVARLKKENPNTIVVSAGDLTGASPLVSNLFKDEPTIEAMNLVGLDFEGVGNHDFDRGIAELRRLQTLAHFHYLAANVLGPDHQPVFPPYEIRELGGVKIAVIGMTLKGTPTVTTKEAIQGLTFEGEAETANALLPELRQKGAHAAIVLLHQGGFQAEGGTFDGCKGLTGEVMPILDALDPAFRVVVTAHTHQAYNCVINGRFVTSAGSFGRLVTVYDLRVDPKSGDIVGVHAKNVPVTHDLPPDPEVEKLVASYEERARPVTERVVGYQRGSLTRDPKTAHSASCETPLGDVIADAELAATKSAGAVFAFMNPGGIRTDLGTSPPGATPDPIRYAAAFEVQPFGNRLVTLTITGKTLLDVLARQFVPERPRVLPVSKGFTYRYAYDKGRRLAHIDPSNVRLNGKPIDPDKSYRVTVNSFLADGGDGFSMFRTATDRVDGPLDIDALVDYLGKTATLAKPLTPPTRLDRIEGDACE